jgi:2-polyprenyl-3-methyl-5-hydroxy-6-metoxy-1,4-benzoquinol methylase/septal ring factor EnvC (AmiA/AmiB activator)
MKVLVYENVPANHQTKVYTDSVAAGCPADLGTSHGLLLELIGSGKRVLEFGCASGYMSARLRDAGCQVTGVEADPAAAAIAAQYCESVIVEDLDFRPLGQILPPTTFDVIVFGDVLEHLRDPWRVLDESRRFIAPGGFAAISIPNVAHGAVRIALLRGAFDYAQAGLLDDTHLRFFTRATVADLCTRAGFTIEKMERTRARLFQDTNLIPYNDEFGTDEKIASLIAADPDHDTMQFVFRAYPLRDDQKFDNAIAQLAAANARAARTEVSARRSEDALQAAEAEIVRQQQTIDMLRVGLETERAVRASASRIFQAASDARAPLDDFSSVDADAPTDRLRAAVRAICVELLALGATVDVYAGDANVSGVTADAAVARARKNAQAHAERAERLERDLQNERLRRAQLEDESEAMDAQSVELREKIAALEMQIAERDAHIATRERELEATHQARMIAIHEAALRERALVAELADVSDRLREAQLRSAPLEELRERLATTQEQLAAQVLRADELDFERTEFRGALAALTANLNVFIEEEIGATQSRIAEVGAALSRLEASKTWRLSVALRKLLRRT